MKKLSRQYPNHGAAYEASEDIPSNRSTAPTLGDVIAARMGRRDVLKGSLATAVLAAAAGSAAVLPRAARAATPSFDFQEIAHGIDETHHVAPGYDANVVIRWGDPLSADAPEFDPENQTAAAQEQQFGYNNDYVGYFPLPVGSDNSENGLLCVNHEYTNAEIMFRGVGPEGPLSPAMTKDLVDIEMSAHGGSVVEVRRENGAWTYVRDSPYNRRLTMLTTYMDIHGPAAGHDRMKTSVDPSGTKVIGTLNDCAGGSTPWGTYLLGEENFHGYFMGTAQGHAEARNFERYGVPGGWYQWAKYHDRFDVNREPNEANRFGWVVEVDPYDPQSVPRKRTALGRFKHEGAESIVNHDGRVVIYSGDDERFEYLYKFVTEGRFNPDDRAANMDLLDHGTLFVARFDDDGTMEWLPLVYGTGPLTEENGFHSQADVVIEARTAADLLGATPMDRPEDVEPNLVTGKVYAMLTNNTRRSEDQVDGPNPRAANASGQVLELTPPDGDHDAMRYTWDLVVVCGDPDDPAVGARWNAATSANGWFACPDNCAADHQGRMWITTDQGTEWAATGTADGVWALETEGELRGTGKMFYRVPAGAEMCGPKFTPNDETLFVAVQHVAADGMEDWPEFGRPSTYEDPATRWPDFDPALPPRPSLVAITRQGGGKIGT